MSHCGMLWAYFEIICVTHCTVTAVQPEPLVAAEPAAMGRCTSEMWVGLAQLNIAQQLCSAYCTAGWM